MTENEVTNPISSGRGPQRAISPASPPAAESRTAASISAFGPLDYLREQLGQQIDRFDRESTKHKRLYRRFRMVTSIVNAAAAVLAGAAAAAVPGAQWLAVAVVAATAGAGVIMAWEGIRKPGDLWITERSALYALKDLQRDLEYTVRKAGITIGLDDYFDRMQAILTSSMEKWGSHVKPPPNGKPGEPGQTA